MPPLAWAQEQEQEAANAHVQATSVWQKKTSFRSPYEGTNSLSGAAEKSRSFTGTAAFGVRLGPSTEAYADPEVALGIPLSGLLGLAGFSNGELAKTSGANPTFYRARLFLRHTIGLGGGKTAVASAANQLASSYDSRRLVITAGNLSLLDLFDANAYAHDPRTQFLNWALMTHAAYDYAADSRGYTSGLAVEYIDDGWAVRAGRFAVPRRPNQLQLDERIMQHHGDQVEVARDYGDARWGGTVRVLAFRMRAVMASYRDALTEADLGGGAPSWTASGTVNTARPAWASTSSTGFATTSACSRARCAPTARRRPTPSPKRIVRFAQARRSSARGGDGHRTRWASRPRAVFCRRRTAASSHAAASRFSSVTAR
jgi:hypothetical protein